MQPKTESRFPAAGSFYLEATGCTVQELTNVDRQGAVRRVENAMIPPTEEQAEGWLVLLQVATARRTESEAFNAAALNLYSGALMRFPADVAKAACAQLARGTGGVTWFPTLGELMDACERLASPRVHMLAALKRIDPPRKHEGPTAEERAIIAQNMRNLAHKLGENLPKPKVHQFAQAKTDETGMTPEFRELLARQGFELSAQHRRENAG